MYSQSNISRFRRKLRNDPFYGVYKHRFFFKHDKADAVEIREWLEERYLRWEGHQYRIIFYASVDGGQYAHSVYMQTISDTDLIYAKMRWNLSDLSVQRGDRIKRPSGRPVAKSVAQTHQPQFTAAEAQIERTRLAEEAQSAGWSAPRLRAKQAWITMRTVGWTAPSTQSVGD
jgi:hypothetical protein